MNSGELVSRPPRRYRAARNNSVPVSACVPLALYAVGDSNLSIMLWWAGDCLRTAPPRGHPGDVDVAAKLSFPTRVQSTNVSCCGTLSVSQRACALSVRSRVSQRHVARTTGNAVSQVSAARVRRGCLGRTKLLLHRRALPGAPRSHCDDALRSLLWARGLASSHRFRDRAR